MENTVSKLPQLMGLNFKKYFVENRKILLILSLGFIGFWIVCGIWDGQMGFSPGAGTKFFYFFVAGTMCAVVASLAFQNLKTKEGRIASLMTPGTALDKFLPRVTATVPGMIILSIIGYYVFTLSILLSYGVSNGIWLPMDWDMFDMSNICSVGDKPETWLALIGTIGMFIFNEALYTFGAVAWPKISFLKTTLVFVGIQMVLSFSGMLIIKGAEENWNVNVTETQALIIGWILVAIEYIVSGGLFYWAYAKFKKLQVIK